MPSSKSVQESAMNSKVLHRFLRGIANLALHSFFTEVRVIGSENVPRDGPIIASVSHLPFGMHL